MYGEFEFDKFVRSLKYLPDFHRGLLLDIGANIGSICIPAVSRGYFGRAIAFEPELQNFELLEANVRLNRLSQLVDCRRLALGGQDNVRLSMELSTSNFGDHRIRVTSREGDFSERSRATVEVSSMRLDSVIGADAEDVSLMWMDTQGYEGFVLSGAERLMSRGVPLVSEFWPYGMERVQSYEPFKASLNKYTTFLDLGVSDPAPRKLTSGALDELFDSLMARGSEAHTDLLFLGA